MKDMLRVTVDDGKYTFVQDETGRAYALRYGEPWRDCVGDGLMLALAFAVDEARTELEKVKRELFDLKNTCGFCVGGENCLDEACGSCIADRPSVFELLSRAQLEIRSYHIDWARVDSDSPDYDKDYKPEFPAIVDEIGDALLRAKPTEPPNSSPH